MTYKKIIELPTGIITEINDRLEGKIKVSYKVREEFNKPINHIVNANKKALIINMMRFQRCMQMESLTNGLKSLIIQDLKM